MSLWDAEKVSRWCLVWDELDCRVKAKQPTSAQHRWGLLQDCCVFTAMM